MLEERITPFDGGRLRYLIGGTGPPLVLCHGFLGSAENFQTWFGELSRVRTLVVPDLPGCAGSSPRRTTHSASRLAAGVSAVCRDAEVERFDLGGLCLGASVALALLQQRPGAVDRLILHTPLLAPRLVRRRFHLQVRVFMAPGLFSTVAWLSRRRVVSDLYKRLMVEGEMVDADAAEANFRNQLRADPRATREWLLHGLWRDDVALLRAFAGPTLIVVAGDDRIVHVPALTATVAAMPHVSLVSIDHAGHGWTADYVRRQLDVIGRFLRDAEPVAGGERVA